MIVYIVLTTRAIVHDNFRSAVFPENRRARLKWRQLFLYPTQAHGIILMWTLHKYQKEAKKSSGHSGRQASLSRLPGQ